MRKYYTRPCNFCYGNYANRLITSKKALPLAGNKNISFSEIEVFERKKGKVKSFVCNINKIKNLKKEIKFIIHADLKNIISKRKNISNLKFNKPNLMGVLNITPDSFSDGGLFYDQSKANAQANLMLKDGALMLLKL